MAKKPIKDDDEDQPETHVTRGAGDNSDTVVEGKKLTGFIKQLETLEKKKDQVLQEIREVYADVRAIGYSTVMTRAMVKLRKMEPEKRQEQEELRALYMGACGLLEDE